jgi:nucleotide-binding universal stress UspA family protein
MQTAELVMEHSSKSMAAPSGIKSILFHIHDDDGLGSRVEAALSIARAFGAHLHLLHVTPIEAYTVVDAFATFANTELVALLEDEASQLKARLERHLASEDVSWTYEEVTGALMPRLIQRAALADLVLTGHKPQKREFGGPAISLLGDMLHRIRTPLFIIGDEAPEIDLFGSAMVGWNGSYEAANSLRSAVPLLKLASQVRLVSVEERNDNVFAATGALEYLSRHGIHAELVQREPIADYVEDQLLELATAGGVSYIVMGGYSHTRAGEFLFGGVTRSLLKQCPISLVMAR